MMVGGSTRVVLNEKMQVANLVKDDGSVHNAWSIDLVELLYCVLLVQVEAEDSIKLFTVLAEASNNEDLGRGNLHADRASDWRWDDKVHLDYLPLGHIKPLNCVQGSNFPVVPTKDEDGLILKDAATRLRPLLVQSELTGTRG